MKKILGLDLGTNSIGWAVVNSENDENGDEKITCIEAAGSRIIPMDAATLGDFAKGNTKSQTKERTDARGIRRLHERHLLRRERLNRVLSVMGFLPEHYDNALTRYGKFKDDKECKIAWKRNDDGKWTFIFMDSFNEMLSDFAACQPDWLAGGKRCLTTGLFIISGRRLSVVRLQSKNLPGCCLTSIRNADIISCAVRTSKARTRGSSWSIMP